MRVCRSDCDCLSTCPSVTPSFRVQPIQQLVQPAPVLYHRALEKILTVRSDRRTLHPL